MFPENKRLFLLYFPGYFDGEELIGIFDDTVRLREAYDRVLADDDGQYEIYLQSSNTELTIAEYHRDTGIFERIAPETLRREEEIFEDGERCKKLRYRFDHIAQYDAWMNNIAVKNGRYILDGDFHAFEHENDAVTLYLELPDVPAIFNIIQWGGWNECPSAEMMRDKAREWYEKYGAVLTELGHDTLVFQCETVPDDRKAKAMLEEIASFAPNSMDVANHDTIWTTLKEKGRFSLWWD